MAIGQKNGHKHAGQALGSEANTPLATIGQYYQINGIFSPMDLKFFTHNTDGTLTYLGQSSFFLFSGSSDLAGDKAAKITYGLFKKGILIPGAETPFDITTPNKTANISITSIPFLEKNDYFDVRAKSDTINTIITVKTLLTTFWGT